MESEEIQRLRRVYALRDQNIPLWRYSPFNPAQLFLLQERERKILLLLNRYRMYPLSDRTILDVGCGDGIPLGQFLQYGAQPENLFGIDLRAESIEKAKYLFPTIDFRVADAEEIPYSAGTFDVVMQFTVFTSILDAKVKRNIARDMVRVLKPDGFILWHDYWADNPSNPHVKGVHPKEINSLFPDCRFEFYRITLAPPITRRLIKFSWISCLVLEKLKFLNTHYLVAIRPSS